MAYRLLNQISCTYLIKNGTTLCRSANRARRFRSLSPLMQCSFHGRASNEEESAVNKTEIKVTRRAHSQPKNVSLASGTENKLSYNYAETADDVTDKAFEYVAPNKKNVRKVAREVRERIVQSATPENVNSLQPQKMGEFGKQVQATTISKRVGLETKSIMKHAETEYKKAMDKFNKLTKHGDHGYNLETTKTGIDEEVLDEINSTRKKHLSDYRLKSNPQPSGMHPFGVVPKKSSMEGSRYIRETYFAEEEVKPEEFLTKEAEQTRATTRSSVRNETSPFANMEFRKYSTYRQKTEAIETSRSAPDLHVNPLELADKNAIMFGKPTIANLQNSINTMKYEFKTNKDKKFNYVEYSIKVGPKLNLLQSNNYNLEDIKLCANEILKVPWPSYSDVLRLQNVKSPVSKTPTKNIEDVNKRQYSTYAPPRRSKDPFLCKSASISPLSRFFCTATEGGFPGPEGTVMPKMRRLCKVRIPEPVRECPPEPVECDTERADNIVIKPKQLPFLKNGLCPCIDDQPTKAPPLVRLVKRHEVEDTPREFCDVEEECTIERADGLITIKPKVLPCLVAGECPCVENIFLEGKPIPRLHAKPTPEPERICPVICDDLVECCAPRADQDMVVRKKKLRPLSETACPCFDYSLQPLTAKPLLRLKKFDYPDPERPGCPVVVEKCPPRADECYVTKKKILPMMPCSECPCQDHGMPTADVKMKRLPKINIPDPIRDCPDPIICPPNERADYGMQVLPKKMPILKPKGCPCVDHQPFIDPVMKRLVKRCSSCDPVRECIEPEPECSIPRADALLKIKRKTLPCLIVKNCPCVEHELIDSKPFPRIKFKKICDPPRVCPKTCETEDCCPPRADENLKVKKRRLPVLKAPPCPEICMHMPTNAKPLCRLPKIDICEPERVCNVECNDLVECCAPKADECMELVKKKTLPTLLLGEKCNHISARDFNTNKNKHKKKVKPSVKCTSTRKYNTSSSNGFFPSGVIQNNPSAVPLTISRMYSTDNEEMPKELLLIPEGTKCVKLKRLVKRFNYTDEVRVCPKPICVDVVRADDTLKSPQKVLPCFKSGNCPCVEPPPTTDTSLKRLTKRFQYGDPERVCHYRDPCETAARADDSLIEGKKCLPKYEPSECACVPDRVMTECPLKKLEKRYIYKDPPRPVCNIDPCTIAVRADDQLVAGKKSLPKFKCSNCPCIDPPPSTDTSLKRLTKRYKYGDPERTCHYRDPCETVVRADDNLVAKKKCLPKYEPGECACPPDRVMTECPLKKLEKRFIYKDPPRPVCYIDPCSIAVRADDHLVAGKKSLPKFKCSNCPCIDPPLITDVLLKRLTKRFEYGDPERVCYRDPCETAVRADDNLIDKKKCLPKYEPCECDCVPDRIMIECPLKKLEKRFIYKDPPRPVCNIDPCSIAVRADDQLVAGKKSLPKFKCSNCPCIDPPPMTDTSLKRLIKRYKYGDPERTCYYRDPCETVVRADDNLVAKKKCLPKYKPGECACPPDRVMTECPLKKLEKRFIYKDPPRPVCYIDPCSIAVRADDHLVAGKKSLPTLKCSNCPCIDPPLSTDTSLKRLTKRFQYGDPERVCYRDPCETAVRADDNLIQPKKCLPKYEPGECACVPDRVLIECPLKKLEKRFIYKDPPRPVCNIDPCTIAIRADDQLVSGQKSLPTLKCGNCPCIDPPPNTDTNLKRLRKRIEYGDPKRTAEMCPPDDPCHEAVRADDVAGYEIGKKTLCAILPNSIKKPNCIGACDSGQKQSARFQSQNRSFQTSAVVFAKANPKKSKSNKPKKKSGCEKVTNSKCPTFKSDCPPRARKTCKLIPKFVECTKQNSPYPCFSECNEYENIPGITECYEGGANDYLQPKNPIIPDIPKMAVPPPSQGPIDPKLEEDCIKKKLCMQDAGRTTDCSSFNEQIQPMRQKDFFKSDTKFCDEKPPVCPEPLPINPEEDCPEEPECPKLCPPPPCPPPPCPPPPCPPPPCPSASEKPFPCLCPPLCPAPPCEENLSFWEKICNYFKARPNCPEPDAWKKKDLKNKAEKAAAAAGCVLVDPNDPKKDEQCEEARKIVKAKICKSGCPVEASEVADMIEKCNKKPKCEKVEAKEDKCEKKEEPKCEKVEVKEDKCEKKEEPKCEKVKAKECDEPKVEKAKEEAPKCAFDTSKEEKPVKKEKKEGGKCAFDTSKEEKPAKKEKKEGGKCVFDTSKDEKPAKKEKKEGGKCVFDTKKEEKPKKKDKKGASKCKKVKEVPCPPPAKVKSCGDEEKDAPKADKEELCGKAVPSCGSKVVDKCKQPSYKNCPPRSRKTCTPPYIPKPCCIVEAPYPSFSEMHSPFPPIVPNECTEQELRQARLHRSGAKEKKDPKFAKQKCFSTSSHHAASNLSRFYSHESRVNPRAVIQDLLNNTANATSDKQDAVMMQRNVVKAIRNYCETFYTT